MGVLSLVGGTYPSFGEYLPWPEKVPNLAWGTYLCLEYLLWQGGYLPLWGGTYLGWGGTYLGQGVPILAWEGTFLFWRGIYTGHGGTFLSRGNAYPDWGYLPCLGRVSTLVRGMYLPWWFQKIFLFGRVWWSWKNISFLGGCATPVKCQNISSCQKDVKCQKVKHPNYRGGSQKKINSHNEVHILMSILMSNI